MNTFAAEISSIRECAQRNDHTGALIKGCELLGPDAGAIKASLRDIEADQARTLHLSPLNEIKRRELNTRLMKIAEAILDDHDLAIFRAAF